jgi:DNA-binding NtrC family response regulator
LSRTVLIVEDEAPLRTSMAIALRRAGFAVSEAEGASSARLILDQEVIDVVVTDLRLLDGDGLAVLAHARERAPEAEVLIVTAFGTIETAVEAMRLGARDFIQKPFAPERLVHSVQRAAEHGRLASEVRRLGEARAGRSELVAKSRPMQEVLRRIDQASASRSVLILGETGTGKELVARAIHAAGARGEPFVVVNCAGLSETFLESELFGHVPGAFTGALGARRGLLADADGGTVFLDEVGEIALSVQAKLLRFLQFGEVRPLGSDHTQNIRARIVAATNRDLAQQVAAKGFREDLLYRLDVFRIELPPLRERLDDLPELTAQLLGRIGRALHRPQIQVDPRVIGHLAGYSWPGNVRELENVLERAVLTGSGPVLLPEHLPLPAANGGGRPSSTPALTLADVERRHILAVLDSVRGDRRRAVQILGISRATLRRKLIEYGRAEVGEDEEE